MLISDNPLKIERIGYKKNDKSEKSFTIATNSSTFRLLSDKIYSRKILSVIRELSCNSFDSHVLANKKDIPFEVQLPNNLNNGTFKVRDFGVAMRRETIESIYCEYGASDKRSTNNLIGQLGLGSKSPFCLVDSFTIISWIDGNRYEYVAYINEEGLPTLSFLSEEESEEPQGVEISFAVTSDKFEEFRREARFCFSLFEPKPIISGAAVTFDEFKPAMEGDEWLLGGNINRNYAVMGNVTYNLELNNVGLNDYNCFHYNHCILYFEIGELDITASREELSYTEKTKKAIRTRVNKVKEEIKSRLENELVNASSYYDACLKYAEIQTLYHQFISGFKVEYKGREIKLRFDLTELTLHNEIKITRYDSGYRKTPRKSEDIKYLELGGEQFFENDLTKGLDGRARQYYKNNKANSGLDALYIFSFLSDAAKKEFLDFYGIDHSKYFHKTSEFDKVTYARTKSKVIPIYRWSNYHWIEETIDNNDITDISKVFNFVRLKRFNIVDHATGPIEYSFFKDCENAFAYLNIDLPVIYGIRDKIYDKIYKDGKLLANWIPASELIENTYKDWIKKNKLEDIIEKLKQNRSFYNILDDADNIKIFRLGVKNKEFKHILDLVDEVNKWNDKQKYILRIEAFLETINKNVTQIIGKNYSINDLFDKMCASTHPMLEFVKNRYFGGYDGDGNLQRIVKYINQN